MLKNVFIIFSRTINYRDRFNKNIKRFIKIKNIKFQFFNRLLLFEVKEHYNLSCIEKPFFLF